MVKREPNFDQFVQVMLRKLRCSCWCLICASVLRSPSAFLRGAE
jgi:hypothetical protein